MNKDFENRIFRRFPSWYHYFLIALIIIGIVFNNYRYNI